MEITVCICTHDRPDYLRDCLDGLRNQTACGDRFEILIVDSASGGDAPLVIAALARSAGAHLVRLEQPGISAARNAGLQAARTPYIAYIDDDAIPAPDWVSRILSALEGAEPPPALIGGRILPQWEQPLPRWWPPSLRGVLSIIEHEGRGEYRTDALPPGLEPYAANMVVHVPSARAIGGFTDAVGRYGGALLSDEEVQLAWALQNAGHAIRYDSRIVVRHQIQARRLTPNWLLSRLYWQGASAVVTRRMTGQGRTVWRDVPRRLTVLLFCLPLVLWPPNSTRLIALRWRLAYAAGFLRAAFGWQAATAAQRAAQADSRPMTTRPSRRGGGPRTKAASSSGGPTSPAFLPAGRSVPARRSAPPNTDEHRSGCLDGAIRARTPAWTEMRRRADHTFRYGPVG